MKLNETALRKPQTGGRSADPSARQSNATIVDQSICGHLLFGNKCN